MSKSVRIIYNDDYGDESCPVCGQEFVAPFSHAVCRHCGFISWGCSLCPTRSHCYTETCPIERVADLYGIFTREEFDELPADYKYGCEIPQKTHFNLLTGNKLLSIYTERSIVGVTTIDMKAWRNGNRDLKDATPIEQLMDG